MATFPAIPPIHPASKASSPLSSRLLFGDGYERSVRFGLNSVRPEWQLEWLVDGVGADIIDGFLQAEAANGFDWQPPDASVPIRWRCDEWTVEPQSAVTFSVKATFRRVFEPASIALTPVATLCPDDELCLQGYEDVGSDFWVSKITAPYSNTGYLYSPSYAGAVGANALVTDAMGYSYSIMQSMSLSAEYLAITKRKLNGEVIWTKEQSFVGYNNSAYTRTIQGVVLGDVGDGTNDIIAFFPEYQGYGLSTVGVYSTSSGEQTHGWHVTGYTEPQGHTLGIAHLPYSKYVVVLRNRWYQLTWHIIDAKTGSPKAAWGVLPAGTSPPPSNIDTPESANFIEFEGGKSIAFFNQYGYRLLVVPLDADFAPVSATNNRYYNCGSGCVVTPFGEGCLVATSARIYYFSKTGQLIREVVHSEGYPEQISADENGIYLVTRQPLRTVKISLDFSTLQTRNYVSASNNNFIGDWQTGLYPAWYTDGGLHLPTNRVVGAYTVFSNNAYAASPSNYPVFQVFGGRASKAGSYTTMSVGEYTASAAGYTPGTSLTSYTTPTSVESNLCSLQLYTFEVYSWMRPMQDVSSKYQWQLYSTDLA